MKKAQNKTKLLKAFTLLEVLVSAAILSIVLAALLSVLTTGLTTWRITQGKIEVDTEGRAGVLLLMQDIDNIILPRSPSLWPTVTTNAETPHLRFLSLKPLDYQDDSQGNVGDVCYIEYFFSKEENSLLRRFYPSKWTYDNILKSGQFPNPSKENAQLLSTNLISELKDSVRGSNLYSEAAKTGFVLLATNNPGFANNPLPLQGIPTVSNPPVGIEINFAATDQTSTQNPQLLENSSYKLRNAGYFSVRFDFPKSP